MRRHLRLFFWFLRDFLRKYRRLIFSGLVFGAFFFFFGFRYRYLLPQPKKTTKIGVVGRYTTGNLPEWLLQKISRGLTRIETDGSVAADLAVSWEVSDDGKAYRFQLQPSLTWQDGTVFRAGDLEYVFKNISFQPAADNILEFSLTEPFAPFPALLSQPVFKKGLLGIGDYRVAGFQFSGDFVRLMKLNGPEALIFKFYPTEKAAILGFKLGEVDRLEQISDLAALANWSQLKIKPQINEKCFVALFFNTQNALFSSKPFRQALLYAIEKPEDKSRALGPLQPESWAYNSQVKPYNYNLPRAKELLQEAGVTEAAVELVTTFSQLAFAEKIKNYWQAIGVKTEVRIVSTLPEDFQVLLASQEIPADPDQYTLWHSTQATNITGYNSPQIDKLLEDGRKVLDQEERKVIYLDFQRFLVEDAPAGFLFHPMVYTISR